MFNKSINIFFYICLWNVCEANLYPQFWAWKLRRPIFEWLTTRNETQQDARGWLADWLVVCTVHVQCTQLSLHPYLKRVASKQQPRTTQHNTTQLNTTQHSTAQHNTTQHSTTQHNTAQHSTAQHNTTQHNTTQHNTAQHNTTPVSPTYVSYSEIFIKINDLRRRNIFASGRRRLLLFRKHQMFLLG